MCLSLCFQLHAWKPKYSMSYVSECVQWLSVKVLVCLHVCVCAWVCVPLCVSEPTPWISGVGHSRDEQSRIKSILILARQEPVLLLGDTSTEREEKRELTLLLLLLLSSALSLTVLRPPALPASSSSSSSSPPHCISVSLPRFLSLSPSCLMLPSLHPSAVAAPYFLAPLSLGICSTESSCWHRGMADGPLWSSRQFGEFGGFQEVH